MTPAVSGARAGVRARRPVALMAIVLLALLQALAHLLWASQWFRAGSETIGQGVLLIPLVGVALFLRGTFATIVATLYVLFAAGAFAGGRPAWSAGMLATVLNVLGLLVLAAAGEPASQILLRGAAAVVILGYLIARSAHAGQD